MKRHLITGAVILGITVWALAAFAPVSFGAPEPVGSACTEIQISDLQTQVSTLRAQVLAAKLTPAQRESRIAARKAAISTLQRQARGSSWNSSAIASARASLQRAKDELSVLADEGARDALRMQIRALQDQLDGMRGVLALRQQLLGVRTQLVDCRA